MVPQLFGTLQVFQQFIGLHPGIELAQREYEEDPQMSSWSEENHPWHHGVGAGTEVGLRRLDDFDIDSHYLSLFIISGIKAIKTLRWS